MRFNDLSRSIKMEIHRDFQSVFTFMVDVFHSLKRSKAQWIRDRNMDAIVEIFCCTWPKTSSLQKELVRTTATAFSSTCWLALLRILNTRQTAAVSHVNISSNILPLMIHTGKNLCFTEFNTKIHLNTRLAASDVFHMFTESIKFF